MTHNMSHHTSQVTNGPADPYILTAIEVSEMEGYTIGPNTMEVQVH